MIECLRSYINSLPEPGLLPNFCLRHDTLKTYIQNQPGYSQIMKQQSGSDLPPLALLGAPHPEALGEQKESQLIAALKSSLQNLSFQPRPPQSSEAQETPEEFESIIADKIDKAFRTLLSKFFGPKKAGHPEDEGFARWIHVPSLESLCSAIEAEVGKPNNAACYLIGKSNQFEMMNVLSEEHSPPCAELLVDHAVTAVISGQEPDWINCQHVRIINPKGQSERSLSDTVYAAASSAWEARRCVCQELVVMSAQDFFDRFPGFAELEEGALGNVHVAILPSSETELSARLYVFKYSEGEKALPDSAIRDLEWVAFKYGNALRRIETRARDDA
jgi:hypothetical protein